MKGGLVLGKLRDARPRSLARSAHEPEDFLQFILVGGAREERTSGVHFCHDAARGPDINAGVVGTRAEENVWRTIPQGDDFVGKGVDRNAESASETKVSKLELALVVDEKILRLEIAMEHAILVAECNSLEQLIHERLDGDVVELATIAARVHVLFQVLVHILEHEHQLVFRMDHIVERDDVFMFELLHEGDLTNGSAGCSLFAI